jgi:hypothetical protein
MITFKALLVTDTPELGEQLQEQSVLRCPFSTN